MNADHPHLSANRFAVKWGELIGNADCPMMRRWVLETPIGSLRVHHFIRSDEDRAMHDHPWGFVSLPLRHGYEDLTWCPDCHGRGLAGGRGGPTGFAPCSTCEGDGRVAEVCRPWRLVWRRAGHKHQVRVTEAGAWTLIATGRKRRTWGFWAWLADEPKLGGLPQMPRFLESRRWFGIMGFPACADDLIDRRSAEQVAAYRAAVENQNPYR
jgi:hypothetical protein